MPPAETQSVTILSAAPSTGASNTVLDGRQLVLARLAWAIVFAGMLVAFVVGIPSSFATMSHACPDVCNFTESQAAALTSVGISLDTFAWIAVALACVIVLISTTLALILFWRRSNDWMVLLVSLFLITYPILNLGTTTTQTIDLGSPAWIAIQILTFPGTFIFYATFLLFPSGRFVPRWTWILFVVFTIWSLMASYFLDAFSGFLVVGYPLTTITIVILQIYRYRHGSTPMQRQQTKWAIAGLASVLIANQLFWLPSGLTPLGNTLYMPISYLFYQLVILAMPITFFIAIQRHRLYDIDTIINRALVYGSVTVVLAAAYAGCIIALQAISRTLVPIPGGSDEPITIVISTLLIAALFQPLRRRVQRAVDHRFYRTRYDARKAVEAFGATLRQEVDIASFSERLLTVVQQTMEPAHVSLWLKDPSSRTDR
ncbi:MAG TPA: hypothetical protein VH591_16725 [Ktedonobacterales bacterium]